MSSQSSSSPRHYALDWLRVLAFSLLIPYHTGMFFVSWDWHIKNNQIWHTLEMPMLFVNQWRMSLLFFISGAVIVFALKNQASGSFLAERARRLLIPLLFGMVVIIPPQTYLQFKPTQEFTSFWDVYPFMMADGLSEFNWNHLWYLMYLFVYSAVLLPLFKLGRTRFTESITSPASLVSAGLVGGLSEFWLRPLFRSTHDLTDDWANHALYLPIFLLGYAIYTNGPARLFIERNRWYFLVGGLTTLIPLYGFYWIDWPSTKPAGIAMLMYQLIKGINRWFWILTLVGLASRYFNFSTAFLRYATEAVFPFYVLHQTVIILLAYPLTNLHWAPAVKFCFIVSGTWLICWLVYEVFIRRVHWVRPLFGLNPAARSSQVERGHTHDESTV